MCPLGPSALSPGFMSSYWTDDEIISSLDHINQGSPIPDNVTVDNPYQYDPSNFREQNNDPDSLDGLGLMASLNPHMSNNNGQHSIDETQVNSHIEGVGSSLVDKYRDLSADELDYIARGDYLELNDLGDVALHSSGSENSSRLSFASDVYFDSMALLRDLDDEKKEDLIEKASTGNYDIMMCVLQPAPLVSLVKGSVTAAKETQQAPNNKKSKSHSEPSPDQAAKRLKAERTDEGPSHSCRATTSPSSSNETGRVATKGRRNDRRS